MAAVTSARFVGRESELARLGGALDEASAGHQTSVVISGPAGVGVSRLIDELELRLGRVAEPWTVVRSRSWAPWAGRPLDGVVRPLVRLIDALPPEERERILGAAVDLAQPDPAGRGVIEPERRQARRLEAIHGVLSRLAARRPVLLVLEDLHCADSATRALAAFLVRVTRPARLCVIVTYQPDDVVRDDPFRETLAAIEDAARPPTRMTLLPLGRDDLANLVADVEGERPSASLLLLVTERSGGNPLVAGELLAARRELSSAPLTGGFAQIVAVRLRVRSPECRRILRLVALAEAPLSLGEIARTSAEFDRSVVRLDPAAGVSRRRAVVGLASDLEAGIDEAIEAGFLVAQRIPGEPPAIAFRHELIRMAVVADILPFQRVRYHTALAAGLDGRDGEVARHLRAALRPDEARAAAIRAAEVADSVDAVDDVVRELELALALSSPPDAPPELKARAASAVAAAGEPARATAYLEAAIAGLDERADRNRLAILHDQLGTLRRAAGDGVGALA
ncbi:MAG TPA: AAA family ATPase, partial [Candidatus Limnocylindrales bacterium]|nr:AAA family ATPase [Candidatus Limnocylindrales bacterium]